MRNNIVIGLLAISITFLSFNKLDQKEFKVDKVVIDAGHGGKDSGGLGHFSKEKNVVLDVSLELGKAIKKNLPDVEVVYTRENDHFLELEERAMIANRNDADVFISLHANVVPSNNSVHGTETYVMGLHTSEGNLEVAQRENSVILLEENYEERYEGFDPQSPESYILFSLYQSAYLSNSLNLASKIEQQFENRVGRNSRGVKQAGFWVLWRTSMPSVLIELGFMSNRNEEKYLNDELGQVYLAHAVFRAFRDYKEEIESSN